MSKDDSSGSSERDSMKSAKTGYDARKRVALRLLARWFDIEWIAAVSLLSVSFNSSCGDHLVSYNTTGMLIMSPY